MYFLAILFSMHCLGLGELAALFFAEQWVTCTDRDYALNRAKRAVAQMLPKAGGLDLGSYRL